MKVFFILFLFFFSFSSWSLSLDWSGWTRWESYYQKDSSVHSDYSDYSNYHFVLQPTIHVVDGLNIIGRLDLSSLGESSFSSSPIERQTGFVFIYGENSKQQKLEFPPLFLRLSQIYMDYQAEFFTIRLGRAPYHFGMGTTYSASQDPFQHWISVYNQAVLYLEHSPFYFQPAILHQKESSVAGADQAKKATAVLPGYPGEGPVLGVAQAGLLNEAWKLEALYQYDFFKSHSFMEVFGRYEQTGWEVKGSASYAFEKDTNMSLALEAFVPIPAKIPLQLEIKSGGAFGGFSFHPNYNVALLFWNRYMQAPTNSNSSASSFQIATGQIQNGIYFSPRLLFSFLDDHLEVRPLLLLARDLNEKKFNYEFDLEGIYQLDENLFFSLKGGALYTKELHLALLAQAAVSF